MKKLLVIVVLCLLWSNKSFAFCGPAGCGYSEAKKFPYHVEYKTHDAGSLCASCYFSGGGYTLDAATKAAESLCLKSKKVKKKGKRCVFRQVVKQPYVKKEKKITQTSKPNKLDINSFKATCKNIGYTEGTEKFTDCVKDIYLRNLDAKSQSNISTSTKSKRKIDPSVWDDIISLSTGVMTGSSKSKTPKQVCFRTGQEKKGFGKSCRYSCTGSLYTMMVGSLEICPLTVER